MTMTRGKTEILHDGTPYTRLTIEELDIDGVICLINRIIKDAVDDYKNAIKRHSTSSKQSLERFFMSEYFQSLTNLNGSDIIKRAEKEARKEIEEEEKGKKAKRKKAKIA